MLSNDESQGQGKPQIIPFARIADGAGKLRRVFSVVGEPGWVPHGHYRALRDDGQPLLEVTYRHGVAHGPYRDFWSNQQVSLEGQYVDGEQDGPWRFYNKDGTLRETILFERGEEAKWRPRE